MDSPLCTLCSLTPADRFCICRPLPPLCKKCHLTHDTSPGFHFSLPIEASERVNPGNQIAYTVWLTALKNSQERLRENINFVEKCKVDIEDKIKKLEIDLMDVKNRLLTTLDEIKLELMLKIEEAIKETTENGYKSEYEPSDFLTKMIWNDCKNQEYAPLPLFTYTIKSDVTATDYLGITFQTMIREVQGSEGRRQETEKKNKEGQEMSGREDRTGDREEVYVIPMKSKSGSQNNCKKKPCLQK